MSIDSVHIRPARPGEVQELSALAVRSKGHWGYDDAFMRQCREELSYSPADMIDERNTFMVAERAANAGIAGFYALARLDAGEWELDALFVEPELIGAGFGRALISHALEMAARGGARRVVIQGDPNAETFYLAAGARRIGERESESVPGRMLPLFVVELDGDAAS